MDDLIKLQTKIWEHYEKGGDSAPVAADKVGGENSGQFGLSMRALVPGLSTNSLVSYRFLVPRRQEPKERNILAGSSPETMRTTGWSSVSKGGHLFGGYEGILYVRSPILLGNSSKLTLYHANISKELIWAVAGRTCQKRPPLLPPVVQGVMTTAAEGI